MKNSASLTGNAKAKKGLALLWPKLRIVLAIGLLVALLYLVNARELLLSFANLRWQHVLYLLILSVVLIWLSCLKWGLFVKAAGYQVATIQLMKYYTMSYFFNMFMPSSIGGDVARSVQLGQEVKNITSGLAITFLERVTGFLAMTFLGMGALLFNVPATSGVELAILLVALLSFSGALVCFSEKLSRFFFALGLRFCGWVGLGRFEKTFKKLFEDLIEASAFARNNPPLFGKAMLLSFAFHFFAVVNTYVAALAVGWDSADFGSLFIVVPLVLLVGAAPITPASVGVQEGAFVFFLIRVGATQAQGLGVALVLRAKNVITALVGGLIWLTLRNKRSS